MTKMCPTCGFTGSSDEFVASFCRNCFYGQSGDLFKKPKFSDFQYCVKCKKALLEGKWVEFSDSAFKDWFFKKIKFRHDVKIIDFNFVFLKKSIEANLGVELTVHGKKIERKIHASIPLNKTTCVTCSRLAGGYHEIIIQVRGNEKDVSKNANHMLKLFEEQDNHVVAVNPQTTGVDILLMDKRRAMHVLNRQGYHFDVNNKLVGRRDGVNLYRKTVLIRLDEEFQEKKKLVAQQRHHLKELKKIRGKDFRVIN